MQIRIRVIVVAAVLAAVLGASFGAGAQTSRVNTALLGRWTGYDGAYCDVWADGNYAYVPNWAAGDGQPARVHILDISDPANPVLVFIYFVPSPNRFASPQDVKVGDGLLFIGLEGDPNDSVAIVDVRTPTSPSLVATVRIPGFQFIHNLFYDGGYLYFPQGNSIAVVDLTNLDPDNPPPSPITTAKWIITGIGSQFVHDVTVSNGRLYAAAWGSGLWIYDVSDVANTMPALLGSVGGNATHSMWPTDDGRFVVTGEERGGGGIKVYEITDNGGSVTLTLRDSKVLPGAFSVHNQVLIGNRLYNSWYQEGFQAFDIDPVTGKLNFVGSYPTSDCWGVYPIRGTDRVLLSDIDDGFFVIRLGAEPVEAPQAAAPPHDVRKNRYVSIDPSTNAGQQVALRVELVEMKRCAADLEQACVESTDCDGGSTGPCVQHPDVGSVWWVREPFSEPLGCLPRRCFTSDGAPCVSDADCGGAAGSCDNSCGPTDRIARLDSRVADAPLPADFRLWDNTTLHIGDCEVVPVAKYEIRACTPPDGVLCSTPLTVETQRQPTLSPGFRADFGDVAGAVSEITGNFTVPDGVINTVDVSAYLFTNQNYGVAGNPLPQVHPTWVDLHGLGTLPAPNGQPPNYILNIADLGQILGGFQGRNWTDDPGNLNPGQCP